MKISAAIVAATAIVLPAAAAAAITSSPGGDDSPVTVVPAINSALRRAAVATTINEQQQQPTTSAPSTATPTTPAQLQHLQATITAAVAAQTDDNMNSILNAGLVSIQSPTYSTLNTNVKYTQPISPPSALRSEGNLYIINTASDYSSSLSANVKVTGGMQGIGEGSVGVGYMNSVQVSDQSTTWIVNQFQTFTQYYSTSSLDPAWINSIVDAYASSTSAQDFVGAYGRYFLSGYKRGCLVSAKYSLACDSVASKQSFQASVSGSFSYGPFSASTDSSFSNAASQSSSVCTTQSQASCTGVACDGLQVSGVNDAVKNMATTCTPDSAALISGYFTPYISLPAFYAVAAKKGEVSYFTSDYTNQSFDPLKANLILSDLNAQLDTINTCLGSVDSNGNYNKCYSRYRVFDRIIAANNVPHWDAVNQLASTGRALQQSVTATFTTVGINADTIAAATSQISAFKQQLNALLGDGPAWKLQVYPINGASFDPNFNVFPTNADATGALTIQYPGSIYDARQLSTPSNWAGCTNYYFGIQFDQNAQNPSLLTQVDCQGGVMNSQPLPLFDTSVSDCLAWNGDHTVCLQQCQRNASTNNKAVCKVIVNYAGQFVFSEM